MQIRIIIILTAVITIAGCQKEDQLIEISLVDAALVSYFRTFEAEANARGIALDASFSEIEARFEYINEGNVVGQCWYGRHGSNEILIDQAYWQRASNLNREFVVFHELGHCYLDRDHAEASTTNGTCLSIMASGTGDCYNRYGASTREAYLDELFFGM